MKFMLTFAWKPDIKARDQGIARFKKTGGKPPKGAKLLGRWTRADFNGGYDLLETDDAQALYQTLGFRPQPEFWSLVVGKWLDNDANP